MRRLGRGRFFATAGEMALGFYAASGPPLVCMHASRDQPVDDRRRRLPRTRGSGGELGRTDRGPERELEMPM
jgi:hypothetical protein